MALTLANQTDCARQLAGQLFAGVGKFLSGTQAQATISHADLLAAVQALDAAFDTALSTAVTQQGGATTVINYLAAQIPAPASGGTAQQKTILACWVLLKRAGLI